MNLTDKIRPYLRCYLSERHTDVSWRVALEFRDATGYSVRIRSYFIYKIKFENYYIISRLFHLLNKIVWICISCQDNIKLYTCYTDICRFQIVMTELLHEAILSRYFWDTLYFYVSQRDQCCVHHIASHHISMTIYADSDSQVNDYTGHLSSRNLSSACRNSLFQWDKDNAHKSFLIVLITFIYLLRRFVISTFALLLK